MAEAVVGSMLGKLQELAISEARTMVAVNEDIRSLRDKLMWMQAFLRDAEPRRRFQPDELIKVWLQQTRHAVFDAEDAVDQYFLQVDLSRFPTWTRAILGFFATFTTQVQVRRDLSRRIRSINVRLEGIITNKDRYKMGDSSAAALGSTWRPSSSTSSLSENLDVVVLPLVGRDREIRDLSDGLFRKTDNPVVISLFGESGVGKTKLMKHLYERHTTEGHFDTQAWVSFGPNLSATRILKLIFSRLTDGDTCSKKELQEKLKDILKKEEKHLLVIDGEVSTSEWNRIFNCLRDGNPGSRVVRISQSKPEQRPACYGHTEILVGPFHNLQDTTELFNRTFFMKEEEDKKKILNAIKKYSKRIFDNTNGLPLAVVLLSGLLRTKEYPEEWKTVFEHLGKKQSKRLDKLLSLCFDDLQYDLKSCFLYFAAFPVNTLIRTQNLVCMWMAEGFLRPKEGKTMEKVGEHYLKELIDRRLVNLAPMDDALPGDERVAVQSKVHAFLQLEAQEESFVEIHSGDDIPTLSTARRLSLQNHRDKYAALAHPLPKLRAILSNFEKEEEEEENTETSTEPEKASGKQDGHPAAARCPSFLRRGANSKEKIKSYVRQLLQNSRFLRVIHFSGLEIDSKLPREIGNAVHLQYLQVTSCSMEEIPRSIGRLCSLQTLDVRDTNVKRLPAAFWRIQTLRHVLGYRLILPKRVGRLKQLHTLNTVVPDAAEGWDDKTFTKMSRLRFLHIREVSADNKPALVAVTTLKYLVLLTIKADAIPSEVFTGSNLHSNLPRLKVMELKGKLEPFPSTAYRFRLPNLARLSLEKTMVSQEFIGKLGELQFLTTLNLRPGSYQGSQLVFASGFRSLRELMVEVELKRIEIHKLALPVLEDLGIFGVCNDLQIEIHDKPRVVEKIKSENEDLYKKITHVINGRPSRGLWACMFNN